MTPGGSPGEVRSERRLAFLLCGLGAPRPSWREPFEALTCRNSCLVSSRLVGRDGHELRPDVAAEAHLADRVPRGLEGELEQAQDGRVRVQVGVGVAPEDPQQLLAVAEQPPEPDLVLGLAQEVLLARRAHEVVVGVAEAHVVQGLRAAQLLVAGGDVDLRVLRADRQARVGVVVALVDVDVDAAQAVDGALEAPEVHVDDVVDRDVQQVADGLDRQRGTAVGVGGVDLRRVDAPARHLDRHLEVARDVHHRGGLLRRVQPHEHHRVRARRVVLLDVDEAPVGAQDEDRLRLAGGHVVEGALEAGDDVAGALVADDADEVLDLEQARGGDRPGREQRDEHARDGEALVHPEGDAGRLFVGERTHTASEEGRSAGGGPTPARRRRRAATAAPGARATPEGV